MNFCHKDTVVWVGFEFLLERSWAKACHDNKFTMIKPCKCISSVFSLLVLRCLKYYFFLEEAVGFC